jgi:hypothetical protein
MEAGEATPANPSDPNTPPQPEPEFEYTARGQSIKEPISKILNRASQGYDYAHNVNQLREQKEAFEREREQFGNQFKSYQELANYAQQNPEWWNHVQGQYSAAAQQQQLPQGELGPEDVLQQYTNQVLQKELAPIKEFISESIAERNRQMNEKADNELKKEIDDTKKQYNFYDFNALDVNGKTLERNILEHAQKIGTTSFRAALRDFYHDDLINRAKSEGLEKAAHEQVKKTKLGLLGRAVAPQPQKIDYRNMNYDQLANLALQDPSIIQT